MIPVTSTIIFVACFGLVLIFAVLRFFLDGIIEGSELLSNDARRVALTLRVLVWVTFTLAAAALFWSWYFYGQFFPLYDPSHLAWVVRLYMIK